MMLPPQVGCWRPGLGHGTEAGTAAIGMPWVAASWGRGRPAVAWPLGTPQGAGGCQGCVPSLVSPGAHR